MSAFPHTVGILLAGGQSLRMGRDKAFLAFRGKPLVDHMLEIMRLSGLADIRISGNLAGYDCISDLDKHEGPAAAMHGILKQLNGYQRYLFVPVDMPLLTPSLLKILLQQSTSCFFKGYPLPAVLVPDVHARGKISDIFSVKGLLSQFAAQQINLPESDLQCFVNTNTPEQWAQVQNYETKI